MNFLRRISLTAATTAALAVALGVSCISFVGSASAQSLGNTALGISALAAPTLVALAPAGSAVPDLKVGVLSLIPDDALGFVVATDVLETKKEGEAVLRKLKIPFDEGDDYADFNKFIDGIEGWDSKSAHALVVLSFEDDDEGIVLVPVTDYKKFAKSFGADPAAVGPTKFEIEDGPDGFIAEKANYAVISGPDGLDHIQRVLDSKKSISTSCDPIKPYLAQHKTALIVAPAGVKKLLGVAIDGIKTIREAIPADNPQAASAKQVFDIYDKIFIALRDEATHIAVGGAFNERVGADFSMQFVFKPEGKLAEIAKDVEPLPPDALVGLPDDAYIVAGAGVFPQSATDALASFTTTMMNAMPQGKGLSPEQAKQLADAMRDSMKNVKRASMSLDFGGETFFSGIAAIYKVDDSTKFLEQYEKAIGAMSELSKKDKAIPGYSIERKKIDGLDVLLLVTDLAPMLEQMEKQQGAAAKQMYQAMFGADGKMTAYFTVVDKETVAFAYDAAALKKLVASVKDGKSNLGDNADLKKTAALLMKQPQAIGFMDVGGYVDLAKRIATTMLAANGVPGGALPFQIPAFPASPPVGVAGKLTPQAIDMQLVVPMQLMENTRDYIQQINALVGGIGR